MSSSIRILYLEDDPRDAELVADRLQQINVAYELRVARNEAEYAALLTAVRFDLILSDYCLPGYDGMSALALARVHQPAVPFILISGALGEEQAVECVLQGATDFVLKQRLERLILAVPRALTEAEEHRKRREAEEALHIRNHALATSPIAIAIADMQGRLTYVNQAFLDLWGYAGDREVLGRSFLEFLTDQERGAALWASALQTVRWSGELSLCRADGSSFVAIVSASVLTNTAGVAVGFIASFFDLTERVQAEQTLRQAMQLAEVAGRAKSEFLNNMTHELRTPLTAILGFSELLTMPKLSPEDRDTFCDLIRISGAALMKLIDDMLGLARLESDCLTVQKVACSLSKLVAGVLFDVRARAEKKGLQLQVSEQNLLPETIYTDPLHLRQVLQNLLDNAVKFTDRGTISLTLKAWSEAGDAARLQFIVSDTGIGIPTSQLGQIFQLFVQGDGSWTRRHGGTGLGLAHCLRLAEALEGELTVTSDPGQGSTFVLTVPVGLAGQVAELEVPAAASPKAVASPALATLRGRVLIAEDEPTTQLLLRNQLRCVGLVPDIAAHGRHACEMVEQSQAEGRSYDLIILDMQMLVMDGYDVARWLRRGGWQGPIVAVTAHSREGDRERCLAAGCDDYLSKPIAMAPLQEILTRYLRNN
ncbi:MAG: response regulator [Planctomycetota bacterium]|nr:response regulator [Planctomycetota bacterium]